MQVKTKRELAFEAELSVPATGLESLPHELKNKLGEMDDSNSFKRGTCIEDLVLNMEKVSVTMLVIDCQVLEDLRDIHIEAFDSFD